MFTYAKDFQAFLKARDEGGVVEIDEEMFGYWLGVLPPVYMTRTVTWPDGLRVRSTFSFAEGAERITAFWTTHRPGEPIRYFARLTDEINRY